jgi:hypothetical protein
MQNQKTINLKKTTDQDLLILTKDKAQKERGLTIQVIELLQEVYSRRLHLKRGYSSLHQYCVKELKYSDGAAFRRIKAMKLVEEVPSVAKSIESGSLSLCTASQLQRSFENRRIENKPIPAEMKQALIAQVENQSRRDTERVLADICPTAIKREEKITFMNSQKAKLELVIDQDLLEKLERLKDLMSHKHKDLKSLIGELVDEALLRADPAQKPMKKPRGVAPTPAPELRVNSRYISVSTKRQVWVRDHGRCTFFDPLTKRKCEGTHKLQFEHIEPFSYGGVSSAENLRLLCASHNGLTAKGISSWRL